MKILIPQQSEKEVEIPVPCFWKENAEFSPVICALLDDETFARIFTNEKDYTTVQHGSPSHFKSEIIKAYSDYMLCDETEFFRAWDDAFESIRLTPKEVTTNNIYSEQTT